MTAEKACSGDSDEEVAAVAAALDDHAGVVSTDMARGRVSAQLTA